MFRPFALILDSMPAGSGNTFSSHTKSDQWKPFSLRGGLSLLMSGFGFWAHDIGGFEHTSTADVYILRMVGTPEREVSIEVLYR